MREPGLVMTKGEILTDESSVSSSHTRTSLYFFIFLMTIFFAGLWVGPRISDKDQDKYCVANLRFSQYIGQSLNCDNDGFIWAATDPSKLFEPQSRRQDRPGSILFAYVVSRPLVWIFDALGIGQYPKKVQMLVIPMRTIKGQVKAGDWAACYLAFIVLNAIVLYFAFLLYVRAIGFNISTHIPARLFSYSSVFLGLFVIANNGSKQFFWSAHTQIFSLLAAMLTVHYFKAIQNTEQPQKMFRSLAVFCGIGMLFYGVFVIPITTIGLGYLWRMRRVLFRDALATLRLFVQCVFAIFLFGIPYGFWYLLIVHLNGAFYDYDIEPFQGFVWLYPVWAQKGVLAALSALFAEFLHMLEGGLGQGWGYMALLLWVAESQKAEKDTIVLWCGAALYAFLVSVFFAFYGQTDMRLSLIIPVSFFPVLGSYLRHKEMKNSETKKLQLFTKAGLLGYLAFMLAKFGPYS